MALLGLDIGSTNSKSIIIDKNGNVLSLKKALTSSFSCIQDCISTLCDDIKKYKIKGLAVSGVGSGGVFLDEYDNIIKLAPIKKHIDPADFLTDKEFINITGYPKSGAGAGYDFAMLIKENPEEAKRVHTFMSNGDYINFLLTGIKRRDLSVSSSLGFQDKRTGENWHEFINHAKINPDILPPIVKSGDFIGYKDNIPVFVGGHDYLCAAFAAGGECVNILGTFDMITIETNEFKQDIFNNEFFVFQDNHVYPGRFATTIEIHGVKYIFDNYPELGKDLSEQLKNPGSVLKKALSEINKISARAFEYLHSLYPNIKNVKAVGGGSNSKEWIKSKSEAFGIDIIVPNVTEASATGAALLAGVGAGVFKNFEDATNLYSQNTVIKYKGDNKND